MVISAKYAGKCSVCGGAIAVGTQIEWNKGTGARHVGCARGRGATPKKRAASPKPRAPRQPSKAGVCEGTELSRWCRERPDVAAEVGRVFRAGTKAGPVSGQVVICVGAEAGSYVSAEVAEDMGHYKGGGYPLSLWVREASAEESAELLAREHVAAAKAEALTELRRRGNDALRQHGDTTPPAREGGQRFRVLRHEPARGSSIRDEIHVTVWDDTVRWYHGGYYDDYRSSWGESADSAEVLALLAAAGAQEVSRG